MLIDDLDLKEETFLGELAREMKRMREDGGDAIVIAIARRIRRREEEGGRREKGMRREEEGGRMEEVGQKGKRREDEGLNPFWLRLFDDVFYLNYPTVKEKVRIMDTILERRGVSLEVNEKDLVNLYEKNTFLKSFADIECFVDKIIQEKERRRKNEERRRTKEEGRGREEGGLVEGEGGWEEGDGLEVGGGPLEEKEGEMEAGGVELEDGGEGMVEGEERLEEGGKEEDARIIWQDVGRVVRMMKIEQVEEIEG